MCRRALTSLWVWCVREWVSAYGNVHKKHWCQPYRWKRLRLVCSILIIPMLGITTMLSGWYQCLCIYALNRPIPRRVMSVCMFMAKKATNSNEVFINKMRTAKCVSENIIVPSKEGWDYSMVLLVGGVLKLAEADQFYKERHDAARFSAWLAEETLKRIYRFKYSKTVDDIHCYIRNFITDHQFGKLKRWIYNRIYGEEEFLIIKSKLLGDYLE